MSRIVRVVVRVTLLSLVGAPWIGWTPPARADALPGDPNDIYFHCTPAEQCPTGSEICPATIGPAGQRPVDPTCAEAAKAKKLEQRCYGRNGHLFCPPGSTGSWKAKPPSSSPSPSPQGNPSSEPKRGC